MSVEKMFEVATRTKMRFQYKGLISVEDLWDLPTASLNTIYKGLRAELRKTQEEESLLNTKTKEDKELEVKIELVKHIFTVKAEEADARAKAREKKAQKEKIKEILFAKQEASLHDKSEEELMAMLSDLED